MDQRLLVVQLNIEHFRRKLAGELDDAQRRTINRLLAEEEARQAVLQGEIAERDLIVLLQTFAQRASGVFERGHAEPVIGDYKAELAGILDRLPCAGGLIDGNGIWIVSNPAMQGLASGRIPSRDGQTFQRWRAFDTEGRLLSPMQWPGARALRGEAVIPGIDTIYTADNGEDVAMRVAAVPVRTAQGEVAGAVAMAYELAMLVKDGTGERLAKLIAEETDRPADRVGRTQAG